jgi:hypothetical protein
MGFFSQGLKPRNVMPGVTQKFSSAGEGTCAPLYAANMMMGIN